MAGLFLSALIGGGCSATCKTHDAATAKCKGAAHSKACAACCGMNGSNINSYWPGSGCTCYK